jgi:hypothetical protein
MLQGRTVSAPFSRTLQHEVLSWIIWISRLPVIDKEDLVDWWQQVIHSAPNTARKGTSSPTTRSGHMPWTTWAKAVAVDHTVCGVVL